MQKIDLNEVWRDRQLLSDIQSEVKIQNLQGWRAWELLLPPDLLWPMLEEVSQGMVTAWSPVINNIGIQVGEQNEVAIRFVLPEINPSPVMVRSIKYIPFKKDNVVPVEVNKHGS